MNDGIIRDIRSRSESVLRGIHRALEAVDDGLLARPVEGWPLWKQFYHILYWLDHWFIDPLKFGPPAFHEPEFLEPDIPSPRGLSKAQLLEYFEAIRARIGRYLADIGLQELERQEQVREQTRSRLDMILGQFTHVSHHIGYICATVRAVTGRSIWMTDPRSP